MERKLVSVQKIAALTPIKNADFIEKATVMGWSLVVKKGEFQEGDLCAFFEIDSVLPEAEWSEFMRSSHFRVRTKKMRGVLSQGLALPLHVIGINDLSDWVIGDDLTALCNVTKYEPLAAKQNSGDVAGSFPAFVPKTDEIRVQSALDVLEELQGKEIYIALKCDGTSFTFAKLDGEIYVCSRNYQLKPADNIYWQVADRYCVDLPEGFAIQGEICAPNIQKNRLGLKTLHLYVFNVFDIKQGCYLDYADFINFCDKYGLTTVPILAVTTFNHTLDDLLALAEGKYEGTQNHREGVVIRPTRETYSTFLNGRLSIKVINNQYLLKGGED